jgi:serine/threonine protein phosphatase PrpC
MHGEMEAAVNKLIYEANRKGGKDNISVVLVKWFDTKERAKNIEY